MPSTGRTTQSRRPSLLRRSQCSALLLPKRDHVAPRYKERIDYQMVTCQPRLISASASTRRQMGPSRNIFRWAALMLLTDQAGEIASPVGNAEWGATIRRQEIGRASCREREC